MTPRQLWGREPAVFFAMLVVLLQSLTLLFGWPEGVQGTVNAALLALGGLLTAARLGGADGVLPALLGFGKAAFAAVAAFGLHWPPTTQVAVLSIIAAAGAFFVRDRVTAPVPGTLSPPQLLSLPISMDTETPAGFDKFPRAGTTEIHRGQE